MLAMAVFLGTARPDWKPVHRIFGVRSWISRAFKVASSCATWTLNDAWCGCLRPGATIA